MKLPRTFLSSRVGRRMLALFVLCAVVPMTVLAIVSFMQVNRLISRNESYSLYRDAFSQGMAIYDRMIFLDKELEMISFHLPQDNTHEKTFVLHREDDLAALHFLSLFILDDAQNISQVVFGEPRHLPFLSGKRLQSLPPDKAMIFTDNQGNSRPSVFLLRRISGHPCGSWITAEVNLEYLLGMHDKGMEAGRVKLSLLEEGRIIFTDLPPGHEAHLMSVLPPKGSIPQWFSWSAGCDRYLSSCAHIFLKSRFVAPLWTLVLSESAGLVLASAAMFRNTFIPVFFMALCLVLLLSIRQIRKSLIPLEKLKESTRKISRGELTDHEVIKSGDEFEDLSESFNVMAIKLDQQFNTLKTMASIDRAILSVLESGKIIETFLFRIGSILPSQAVGVYIHDSDRGDIWHLYARNPGKPEDVCVETIQIPDSDLEPLRLYKEYIIFRQGDMIYPYLRRLAGQDMKLFFVLPIMVKHDLYGFIALAERQNRDYSSDYIINARQIADHMAVAFANAGLLDELNQLNWGTLTALAQVVDAKSPWTAGHSERVADIAVGLGKEAGLPERDLVILNKAGLLHDIGKIRTPQTILDKPGRLTKEELDIIRRHPEDSVCILEPITPYRDIIPPVLQHHERFDGKGYPLGISGEGISLLGRILAVADSFDAMVSDRPYREGKSLDAALEEARKEAGKQFDPKIVQVLGRVVSLMKNEEGCR